jgi:hypothetical protein
MSKGAKFDIAGFIVNLVSRYPIVYKDGREFLERYEAFCYRGRKKADISVSIEVVRRFPAIPGRALFVVREPASGFERWRLWKYRAGCIYYCPMRGREVMAWVRRDFSLARAYTLPYRREFVWDPRDIIYDFLQIMLINYLAYRKEGLLVHAAGIKEDNRALVFAGKSESGKSTTARLWHAHSNAVVLNDDRIILRKSNRGFRAYSGPWHGEFGHEKKAVSDDAALKALFIIEHAKNNFCRRLCGVELFNALYPVCFSVFWDAKLMNNVLDVCRDIMERVAVFRLGFVKNKNVIPFVRRKAA